MSDTESEAKVNELKAELMLMEKERKEIEEKLKDQRLILETNNVGMKDSLVDKDDFPRQDIDVWKVRTARATISRLENDAKEIFGKMATKLEELHSLAKPRE